VCGGRRPTPERDEIKAQIGLNYVKKPQPKPQKSRLRRPEISSFRRFPAVSGVRAPETLSFRYGQKSKENV
jgi:hypothetical protein